MSIIPQLKIICTFVFYRPVSLVHASPIRFRARSFGDPSLVREIKAEVLDVWCKASISQWEAGNWVPCLPLFWCHGGGGSYGKGRHQPFLPLLMWVLPHSPDMWELLGKTNFSQEESLHVYSLCPWEEVGSGASYVAILVPLVTKCFLFCCLF